MSTKSKSTKSKATRKVDTSIITTDLSTWSDMSDAKRKSAADDATKAGRTFTAALLAEVKNGEREPLAACDAVRETFGQGSDVESLALYGTARAKAHAAAVQALVRGLVSAGILVTGKGKRPGAGQVSAAQVAEHVGVTRGRIAQIVVGITSDTHDTNGKRTDSTDSTDSTDKRTDGLATVADIVALVTRLDDKVTAGVAHTADDAEALTRAAATLRTVADTLASMTRPAATPADVPSKRTA